MRLISQFSRASGARFSETDDSPETVVGRWILPAKLKALLGSSTILSQVVPGKDLMVESKSPLLGSHPPAAHHPQPGEAPRPRQARGNCSTALRHPGTGGRGSGKNPRKWVLSKHIHETRDPIHVFVRLDSDERAVLDSRPFQRLRHIHPTFSDLFNLPCGHAQEIRAFPRRNGTGGPRFRRGLQPDPRDARDSERRGRVVPAKPTSILAASPAHGRSLSRHGAPPFLARGGKGTPPRWLGPRAADERDRAVRGNGKASGTE